MRNPSRKAAIHAAVVAFGLLLAWLGVREHRAAGQDWVSGVMIAGGFMAAFASTVLLLQALVLMRGMARLRAGVGRVAAWHVGAAEWEKFRLADAERVKTDPQFLVNDLWIRRQTPPDGVDVIVGEKSLIVDNSYHVLRIHGLPELRSIGWLDNSATPGRPPDCLEFLLAYPRGRYGGTQHTCLRVPVPEAARTQGRQAYLQFAPALERRRAKGAIALRNPRRTLQVCGALLAASLLALGWGWLEAERTGWSTQDTLRPILLLIGGAMGAIFAVVLGGLTLLLRPKATR